MIVLAFITAILLLWWSVNLIVVSHLETVRKTAIAQRYGGLILIALSLLLVLLVVVVV